MKNFIKIILILALLLIVAGCTGVFKINSIDIKTPQYTVDMSCASSFNKGCSLSTTTIGFTKTVDAGDYFVYYAVCLPNNVEKGSYISHMPTSTVGDLNQPNIAVLFQPPYDSLPKYTDCTWSKYGSGKIAVNKAGGYSLTPASTLLISDYLKFNAAGNYRISFAFTSGTDGAQAGGLWATDYKDITIYGCKSDSDCPKEKPSCDASKNCVCISAAEVCDAKDNDCDAQVDEFWPKTLSCPGGCGGTYTESCTKGVLTDTKASCPSSYNCMDYATCQQKVQCTQCTGTAPQEFCNDKDDDCDGIVDDGCDDDNDDFCDNTMTLTGASTSTCTKGGGDADDNDNTVYPGAPELCDNKDNDQNGVKDDIADEITRCGCGPCASTGIRRCVNGVMTDIKVCQAPAPTDSEGKNYGNCADGIDNNCDCKTDMQDFNCFCTDIMMKCADKIGLPDGSVKDYAVCTPYGTPSCCGSSKDCVVNGQCYKYVGRMPLPVYKIKDKDGTEKELVCSAQNTWCPKGFKWVVDKCVPEQKACYPDPCAIPDPLTPDWFNNPACTVNDPINNKYEACCITSTIAGTNYYNYVPVRVY